MGAAGRWISPELVSDSASSARWRFGELVEFGCITDERDDQGDALGSCLGQSERVPH